MLQKMLLAFVGTLVLSTSFAHADNKCYEGICIGERYIHFDAKKNICEVTGFTTNFNLLSSNVTTIQAECSDGSTVSGVSYAEYFKYFPKGCTKGGTPICVGDKLSYNGQLVKIIGISRLLLKYGQSGDSLPFLVETSEHKRGVVGMYDTSKPGLCFKGLCAGDRILYSRSKSVMTAGHYGECSEGDSLFGTPRNICKPGLSYATVKEIFLMGDISIVPEGGNDRPEVKSYAPTYYSVLKGCAQGLCVGQKVMTRTKREATIEGLNVFQETTTYVLKFSDNGKFGEDWQKSDLTVIPQAK